MNPTTRVPETEEDGYTRQLIREFLDFSLNALKQLLGHLARSAGPVRTGTVELLQVLYLDAENAAPGIRSLLSKGLNRYQRQSLKKFAVYGETLHAKIQNFWDLLRDGSLGPVLRIMNSILGSLAKVFSFADILKECKDHIEVTIDSLGPDGALITLNLSDLPDLGAAL